LFASPLTPEGLLKALAHFSRRLISLRLSLLSRLGSLAPEEL